MACRLASTAVEIAAWGNAACTVLRTSSAVGANAPMLYTERLSRSAGAVISLNTASTASGIAMNGIRVSGRTKHAYGSPFAAA